MSAFVLPWPLVNPTTLIIEVIPEVSAEAGQVPCSCSGREAGEQWELVKTLAARSEIY